MSIMEENMFMTCKIIYVLGIQALIIPYFVLK